MKQRCRQVSSVKGFKVRGLRPGWREEIERNKQGHSSCSHSFPPPLPLCVPSLSHYSSIISWAVQLFQDVRTTKLPWIRECEAQGGEGVWNSWPSGGASCSFALNPLASWDTTEMAGWGGLVQYVQRGGEETVTPFSKTVGWSGVVGEAVWPTWPKLEENWDGDGGSIICFTLWWLFKSRKKKKKANLLNNSVHPFTSLIELRFFFNT